MRGKWREVHLGDVAEIVMGQSPPGSTYNESGDGLPFFQGVKDFGYRNPTPRVFCSRPSRVAQLGDILFSVRAPIGRVNIADRECTIGRGLSIIQPRDKADSRYIEFALRYLEPTWQAIEGGGSVFGNATRQDVELLSLTWPDEVSDRRIIAEVLGSLDDKIELNRRMNATLESMARAVFKAWFVENEEAKGWKVGSILEFAELLSGGTPSTQVAEYWNGDIKWVSAKDVGNAQGTFVLDTERKITHAGVEHSSTKILPELTTIVTARGTVGSYCILDESMAINQTNYGLKAKEKDADYFVFFSLANLVVQLRQAAYGTIFDTVTTRTFETSEVVIPPVSEIAKFNQQVQPMMEMILSNLRQSRTLAALRDALLPRLMSGEVRVSVDG